MFYIFIYLCEKYFSMRLSKDNPFQIKLLPHYFKKIAIGLFIFIAIATISMIVLKHYNIKLFNYETTGKTFLLTTLMTALLLYIFSEEKKEDEMIKQIRFLSCSISFFGMVIFLIINSYINIIFGVSFEIAVSVPYVTTTALMHCILIYYFLKFY